MIISCQAGPMWLLAGPMWLLAVRQDLFEFYPELTTQFTCSGIGCDISS